MFNVSHHVSPNGNEHSSCNIGVQMSPILIKPDNNEFTLMLLQSANAQKININYV